VVLDDDTVLLQRVLVIRLVSDAVTRTRVGRTTNDVMDRSMMQQQQTTNNKQQTTNNKKIGGRTKHTKILNNTSNTRLNP
jgi:hypothetical protein